jgi:hypothetical protein
MSTPSWHSETTSGPIDKPQRALVFDLVDDRGEDFTVYS